MRPVSGEADQFVMAERIKEIILDAADAVGACQRLETRPEGLTDEEADFAHPQWLFGGSEDKEPGSTTVSATKTTR